MSSTLQCPSRVLGIPSERSLIVNVGEPYGSTQALVLMPDGTFAGLKSSDPWGGLVLGQPTPVRTCGPSQNAAQSSEQQASRIFSDICSACWDPYSGCVYAARLGSASREGPGLVRLSVEGAATTITAQTNQAEEGGGSGRGATLQCYRVASDGLGCLYLLSGARLHRLHLPAAWQAAPSGVARFADAAWCRGDAGEPEQQGLGQGGLEQGGAERQPRDQQDVRGPAADAVPTVELQVAPLPCGPIDRHLSAVAYDPVSRSLVLCTSTAVYRLPVEGLGAATGGEAVQEPVLIAGRKAEERGEEQSRDGVGTEARFSCIVGLAVDGAGGAWVLDLCYLADPMVIRLVHVHLDSGRVTTVPAGLTFSEYSWSLAILRNGCLALMPYDRPELLLLHLGLTPQWSGPAHGTLPADLGGLLDRQPDGSADVEVEVGGQVFVAHRQVLAARSLYFRQRLDPEAGFADGGAPRLSLPDADPAVFGAVLRFMYTDSAGPVPPKMLQPVGELADRLLLPGLCAQVGSQLLWRVSLETVVGLLLWAEQRSGSFGPLLGGLKEWVLDNTGPESGRLLPPEQALRLMRDSPALALQLLYTGRAEGREHKRRRPE